MASGCITVTRQVKGDDRVWCHAGNNMIAAAVADGVSISDPPGQDAYSLWGWVSAEEAIEGFRSLYEFMENPESAHDLLCNIDDYFNFIMGNTSIRMQSTTLRRIRGFLDMIFGKQSQAKIYSASTLAGGVVAGNGGLLVSVGDSQVRVYMCPRNSGKEGDLIALLHAVKDAEVRGLPTSINGSRIILNATLSRGKKRASIEALNPLIYVIPAMSIKAISRLYSGATLIAWTDGMRLESKLLSVIDVDKSGVKLYTEPLKAVVKAVEDSGLADNTILAQIKEGITIRRLLKIDATVSHVLAAASCLAAEGLVPRSSVNAFAEYLADATDNGVAELDDDRSIAISYTDFSSLKIGSAQG